MWQPSLMIPDRSPLFLPRLWLPLSSCLPPYASSTCCKKEEECNPCDGVLPDQWQVEFEGVLHRGDCTDEECDYFNNTAFVVDYFECTVSEPSGKLINARWAKELPSPVCGVTHVFLRVLYDFTDGLPGTWTLWAGAGIDEYGDQGWWHYSRGIDAGKLECVNVTNHELENYGQYGSDNIYCKCHYYREACRITVSAL